MQTLSAPAATAQGCTITGTAGSDVICGFGGNDTINSVDTIFNDFVDGGTGTDTCTLDPGVDFSINCP